MEGEGQIRVCVCVCQAVADHSLLLVPYFNPSLRLGAELLNSFLHLILLFPFILIHFGQLVDGRSRQRLLDNNLKAELRMLNIKIPNILKKLQILLINQGI